MNHPARIDTAKAAPATWPDHAYSRTCNCDACFETWLTMPEPTPEERQAMAREFSRTLAPSGGGELLTDWPKVSFPDLDRDADLQRLARGHRKFNRERRKSA